MAVSTSTKSTKTLFVRLRPLGTGNVGQWPNAFEFASTCKFPWVPDRGDGTFQNPIIFADYSDPDVIRDGDDYYLVSSSFNCVPGLPILHSRDLVNWTIINHAVKNLPDPRGVFHAARPGEGIWAPAIRKHDGRFWIFFPMPDEGIYLITADHPAGEWSVPHLVAAGKGLIDPCPLWDADGNAYLVHAYARSRSGIKHRLRVCPMAADGSRLLGAGHVVFDEPHRHPTLEGPKFLKHDGYYYILAPAGGVETGWQLALRSKSVYGPYEAKIVLERGSTPVNGPHQGALVDSPEGDWWFVHFQDIKPYGRVVHLQPVTWVDGWPTMGIDHDRNGVGEPVGHFHKPVQVDSLVERAVPQTSDEFEQDRLGLQWQWHGNWQADWYSLAERPGWLRLFSQYVLEPDLFSSANLLMQKFPASGFTVETLMDAGAAAESSISGLIIMGLDYAGLGIRKREGSFNLEYLTGVAGNAERTTQHAFVATIPTAPIRLRAQIHSDATCTFSYFLNDSWKAVSQPGFRIKEGIWIGAKAGIFSSMSESSKLGYADFDYVRFSMNPEERV